MGIGFIANIKLVCPSEKSPFSEEEQRIVEACFEGEHGVKKDGTLLRLAESFGEMKRTDFVLDVCENYEAIQQLCSWVSNSWCSNQEFFGEGIIIYSSYGKAEVISACKKSFFILSMRENSLGFPEKSKEIPEYAPGSLCMI